MLSSSSGFIQVLHKRILRFKENSPIIIIIIIIIVIIIIIIIINIINIIIIRVYCAKMYSSIKTWAA